MRIEQSNGKTTKRKEEKVVLRLRLPSGQMLLPQTRASSWTVWRTRSRKQARRPERIVLCRFLGVDSGRGGRLLPFPFRRIYGDTVRCQDINRHFLRLIDVGLSSEVSLTTNHALYGGPNTVRKARKILWRKLHTNHQRERNGQQ